MEASALASETVLKTAEVTLLGVRLPQLPQWETRSERASQDVGMIPERITLQMFLCSMHPINDGVIVVAESGLAEEATLS